MVGVTLFLPAFSLGTVMAPATDAVMGAVPRPAPAWPLRWTPSAAWSPGRAERRSPGLFTVYGNRVVEAVADLPSDLAAATRDPIGTAIHVAATLPPDQGEALATAAGSAFVDAIGRASLIGCCIALLGSTVVLRFMPPHHPEHQEDEVVPVPSAG